MEKFDRNENIRKQRISRSKVILMRVNSVLTLNQENHRKVFLLKNNGNCEKPAIEKNATCSFNELEVKFHKLSLQWKVPLIE